MGVYLAAEDVMEELDGVGATVSFKVYTNKQGLGAADVKMSKAQQGTGKSNAVADFKAGKGGKGNFNSPQQPAFQKKGDGKGKGKGKSFQQGKGHGKVQKTPQREIIHDEPLL